MLKLKKIIKQVDADNYHEFEDLLKISKSVKFLYLLRKYRADDISDEEIKSELNCTDNSYYVLKSRLYDKLQKFLFEVNLQDRSVHSSNNLTNISSYLYEYQPETAVAMLLELEKKYLDLDSPNELIYVYSTLKKAHFYSEKYYAYSQTYNNHIAYVIAIEKTEDTLANFVKTLASYHFTANSTDLELIKLIIKEIKNIYSLYKSPRVEIIHNIILIQTYLFAQTEFESELPIEDLLDRNEKIIKLYKDDRTVNYLEPVNIYLNFEYYLSLKQIKKAKIYFTEIDSKLDKWLLNNRLCLSYNFLFSKISFLNAISEKDIIKIPAIDYFFDNNDLFTSVIYRFYLAIVNYQNKKIKNSISLLNEILNEVSFKNYFYIETEIKLTLSFYYIINKEIENSDNTLRGLSRKVTALKSEKYINIKEAIKLLTILSNGLNNSSNLKKFNESLAIFNYYNSKNRRVLNHLEKELETLSLGNSR